MKPNLIQRARSGVKRNLWITIAPGVGRIGLAFFATSRFIKPALPDLITLSTGAAAGAYHGFAQRYAKVFEREGVTLVLNPSKGSVDNLARLKDDAAGIDSGFVQGGLGLLSLNPKLPPPDETTMYSLATLFHEPVWVFYRIAKTFDGFGQLKGLRVAVGAPGSGTRKVALELLTAAGVDASNTSISDHGGKVASELLDHGRLDAGFLIAAPKAPVVQALLTNRNLKLISLAQAEGYTRHFPSLTPVALAAGVADLKNNIPAQDVTLLANTANLVIRRDLHPALAYLLLEAAVKVYGTPELLHRPGEFPGAKAAGFPLAPEARRYFQTGRPFLQRYLPFWLANFIERMLVLLIPLVAVVYPVVKLLPEWFFWRVKNKIYKSYGELNFLGRDLGVIGRDAVARAKCLARLDEIEASASDLSGPLALSDRVYTLRGHIEYVRQRWSNAPPAA